jgi:5'-deoxynucleotidase YfbR-like HD superfamily hydrolase
MLYFWPNVRREMIYAALHHDCGELVTGDVPYAVKQARPELAKMLGEVEEQARADMAITPTDITPGEHRMLKFCDRLEAYTFIAMYHPHRLSNADWIEDRAHIDDTAKKLGVQARLKDWFAR